MNELCVTLIGDGASDERLLPILVWLLRQHASATAIQAAWADLSRLRRPPRGLSERIRGARDFYPCDILFVHRDAEGQPGHLRVQEVSAAADSIDGVAPVIPVVPVRMTEAWLLINEQAIRLAAGNPHGSVQLDLPRCRDLEGVPDPKAVLNRLLIDASELTGRRRKKFDVRHAGRLVAEFIED